MVALLKYLIPLGLFLTILVAPATTPEAHAARRYSRVSVGMALQDHSFARSPWRHNRSFRPHFRSNLHHIPSRHMGPWHRYPRHYSSFGYSSYVGRNVPFGFRVATLPRPYTTVVINSTPYYIADGVYYRNEGRGYIVVEAPELNLPKAQRTYPASDLVVEVDRTHMRSGPSEDHPVTGQAFSGQPLTIVGEAAEWYYVQHPHGHYGWVPKNHTRPAGNSSDGD